MQKIFTNRKEWVEAAREIGAASFERVHMGRLETHAKDEKGNRMNALWLNEENRGFVEDGRDDASATVITD